MSKNEIAEFEKSRFFREAVRLRKWDDLANVEGIEVPGLENYREAIEATERELFKTKRPTN